MNKKVRNGLIATFATLGIVGGVAWGADILSDINNSKTNVDGDKSNPGSSQDTPKEPENKKIPELDNEAFSELTKVESEDELVSKSEDLLGLLELIAPNKYTLDDVKEDLISRNDLALGTTQNPPLSNDGSEGVRTEVMDINDTEKVGVKVSKITEAFQKHTPELGVTDDFSYEAFNMINGGEVENTSVDDANFVLDTFTTLLTAEKANAEDVISGRKSNRPKPTETIDYSIFFLDGTLAHKLAMQIGELRKAMILNAGSDISQYQKQFVELYMNSWVLKGNKAINSSALETSGMEAMIDILFYNTAPLCGDASLISIKHPVTGEDITFEEIINASNSTECEVILYDENGEEIERYDNLNKITNDTIGMAFEAQYNKDKSNGKSYRPSK